MNTIYLAIASTDYEGYSVMRAFEAEDAAELFLVVCRTYAEKEPECPALDDSDAIWDAYRVKHDRWAKREPKDYSSGDRFSVMPVPYFKIKNEEFHVLKEK